MTKSSKRASRAPKSRVANRRATKGRAPQRKTGPNRKSTELRLAELKRRLLEISDLEAAESLLGWDHATYMPEGGAVARARQGATLSRLAHEKSVDPALGRLLDGLQPYADGLASDSDDAGLLRVARRDFEKAIRVPPSSSRGTMRTAPPPMTRGRGRGRRTTSRSCCRSWKRRSS